MVHVDLVNAGIDSALNIYLNIITYHNALIWPLYNFLLIMPDLNSSMGTEFSSGDAVQLNNVVKRIMISSWNFILVPVEYITKRME